MNIDLTKYLKNKDIKFKNEDFDIEALANDVKGEATKGYVSKTDYDKAVKDKEVELTTKYSQLENNYNSTVKQLSDTNANLSKVSLEKTMISKGFKEDQFDEVSKLRSSLFSEEKDDVKAVESIATKFKDTYFKETTNTQPIVPNEGGLNGGNQGQNNGGTIVKITRDTPLSSLTAK